MPDYDDLFKRFDSDMSKNGRGSDHIVGWLFGKSAIAALVVVIMSTGIGATFQLHSAGQYAGEIQLVAASMPQEPSYSWAASTLSQEFPQGIPEHDQHAAHQNVHMRHHAQYIAMYADCNLPLVLHHGQQPVADLGIERRYPQFIIDFKTYRPNTAFTCGLQG